MGVREWKFISSAWTELNDFNSVSIFKSGCGILLFMLFTMTIRCDIDGGVGKYCWLLGAKLNDP